MGFPSRSLVRSYLQVRARQQQLARAHLQQRLHAHGDRLRWRVALRSRRSTAVLYRSVVTVAGVVLILIGLPMVPLIGPGWAAILTGLFLLSTEFAWARSVSLHALAEVRTVEEYVRGLPWTAKAPLLVLSGAVGWVCFYLALLAVGLPAWLPQQLTAALSLLPGVHP